MYDKCIFEPLKCPLFDTPPRELTRLEKKKILGGRGGEPHGRGRLPAAPDAVSRRGGACGHLLRRGAALQKGSIRPAGPGDRPGESGAAFFAANMHFALRIRIFIHKSRRAHSFSLRKKIFVSAKIHFACVHGVDLVKCFPTSICLQNSASRQPTNTSPVTFARSPRGRMPGFSRCSEYRSRARPPRTSDQL